MKVALKVPLTPYLGYGNDGIGIASELVDYGVDLHLVPGTLIDSPLPAKVAALFTKDKAEKYDLTIHHLDPDNLGGDDVWGEKSGLKVAWTMWEFSNFKNAAGYETMRDRFEYYDVFVAYDQVTADCLREVFDGPIIILQGGFQPENFPFFERDWFDPDHFRFCMNGQLHDRKDPFVAIQAFSELKDEYPEEFAGAELHLKNSMPGVFPALEIMNQVYEQKKIRIYSDIWDKDMLDRFYASMHCLVAPSRGEGKNLPALEMQSTGAVVIATDWGGHTQWLNSDYAYRLNFTLRPVDNENRETLNARADTEHLKELMLHVYRNRAEAKKKGELASQVIPAMCSWESVVARLLRLLGEHDPKLTHLAAVARQSAGRDDDD